MNTLLELLLTAALMLAPIALDAGKAPDAAEAYDAGAGEAATMGNTGETLTDAAFDLGSASLCAVDLVGELTGLPAEQTAAVFPVSLSPDGRAALLADGQALYAWRDGKISPVLPNWTRGVRPLSANADKLWAQAYRMLAAGDATSVAWSPDGRYATVTSYRQTLLNARFDADPHLIDMETGEVFLTAAYGTKPAKDENAGAPTAACFSRDGRYVYYMLYGRNIGGCRTALTRYDLQTGRYELCCSATDLDYYPPLCELRDGSLLMLRDVATNRTRQQPMGLARYAETGAGWMSFGQPFRAELTGARVTTLRYNADSGCALTVVTLGGQYSVLLQRFFPDRDYEGLGEAWAFDAESGALTAVSAAEATEALKAAVQAERPVPYETVFCAALSPDGRYALCKTASGGQLRLRMIRLSDMSAIPVSAPDEQELLTLPADRNTVLWCGDTLLISTQNGVKAFEIEAK